MRDSQAALNRGPVEQVLQFGDLAHGTDALQVCAPVAHRDTGGIVATVFQAAQPLHEDGDDVAFRDGAYDAAQVRFSRLLNL
jgi:hypothetical protein